MNKSDLIGELSEETQFSKKDITRVLESFQRIVQRSLKKGEKIQMAGFGTFLLSFRPERMGINPATKQRIKLKATNVPKFKPGKGLREAVRSARSLAG